MSYPTQSLSVGSSCFSLLCRTSLCVMLLGIASTDALAQKRFDKEWKYSKAKSPSQGDEGAKQPGGESDDKETKDDPAALTTAKFGALKARGGIGAALMSGRISDIAVDPNDRSTWYVAVASGGVWKTTNRGATFSSIFDNYGSYAVGCVTIDPNNSNVIWVGSGENNSQRSVAWGDGVYVSRDAGKSFKNIGLKDSGSIGMIKVDPRDSNVVYVASFGPLWSDGGDRGLYKTTDGGKTWEKSLDLGEQAGVSEVHMDPRDANVLYATAYQRRRHVWTLIDGGPKGGIHKSADAGKTWKKLGSGLPLGDVGRIGMTISANPDVLYAIVEGAADKSGIYRSTDRGESWEKRSGYLSSSPQYYQELIADPKDENRFYSMDTFLHTTDDGGKTMKRVEHKYVHVDWHALVVDPTDTNHLLGGNDGGLYETFDRTNWRQFRNLPITQYYRVAIDNSLPFYYIYGGTQDNNTLGGPSRTTDNVGVSNEDWFVTVGGDGFEPAIDPEDPNCVYSQWQDGGLIRFDRKSGEQVDIRPLEKAEDKPFVFNWDAALIISPHSHTRLYFAGNYLFRSDDRGNSWKRISEDLTRGLDRNQLEVMGVIQKPDAIAKHKSTSIYGSGVSMTESPMQDGLIYIGTDDGLINITEDAGKTWRKVERLPDIDSVADIDGKQLTLISDVKASRHDASRVYATVDNHKFGDYRPYVFKSNDKGVTWTSIAGDLPERETCYSIVEDHVNPNLLFVGTEFGTYFTLDGGTKWFKLSGIPTIDCRDLEIQRRENDLAIATFGRGFYILDDYTPLRTASKEVFGKEAHIFPIRAALNYVQRSRLGGTDGKGWSGSDYYAAPNPPFGAIITYHIKEKLKTKRELRQEAEKKDDWKHATIEELQAEDREVAPKVVLIVRDDKGNVLRQLDASRDAGLHRASWNLRLAVTTPVSLSSRSLDPWESAQEGSMVPPGTYSVQLAKIVDGVTTMLDSPVSFEVRDLDQASFAAKGDARAEKFAFERKVSDLQRAVEGTSNLIGDISNRLNYLRKGISDTPGVDPTHFAKVETFRARVADLQRTIDGDRTLGDRAVAQVPALSSRVNNALYNVLNTTQPPTTTNREQYAIAADMFEKVLADTKQLVFDVQTFESILESAKVPWTPGRVPEWKR